MSTLAETAMQTAEAMRRLLTEKAEQDADFRAELLADPKAVFAREFGIIVPEGIEIKVHESDRDTFHLALPADLDLDEEQLKAIAAGLCCCI